MIPIRERAPPKNEVMKRAIMFISMSFVRVVAREITAGIMNKATIEPTIKKSTIPAKILLIAVCLFQQTDLHSP